MDKIPASVLVKALDAAPALKAGILQGLSVQDILASLDAEVKAALAYIAALFSGVSGGDIGSILQRLISAVDLHPMTPEEEQAWFDRVSGQGLSW